MFSINVYFFIFLLMENVYSEWDGRWQILCPEIYPHSFTSYAPIANLTAGKYIKQDGYANLENCVAACCSEISCNVALVYNKTCYHVECLTTRHCTPLYREELQQDPPIMILVKPVGDENWNDYIDSDNLFSNTKILDETDTRVHSINCIAPTDCSENEICLKDNGNSYYGVCVCTIGYHRDKNACVLNQLVKSSGIRATPDTESLISQNHQLENQKPLKKLFVRVVSKEVQLPENEVTLSAFTVPSEQENEHYNYVWSLLSQPEGQSGIMTDQNQMKVKLSNLSEGLYKFKVSVSGTSSYGEAYANVSVLPPKRVNQAPVAVILPASQTVKLPNNGAVLDGSASRDDDKVIAYHWELQQGPIGYQPKLVDTPTLQLDNLIPGNYTFKLTVTDSDHISNSTTSKITVLNFTDYPPTANAGGDIIIYLPQNTLTLNGNLSSDDRGIANWEWTKSPSDENKAVDMQNTRTPYLQLSNLEEGMYTFTLKVTDDSEQSSTADVHVFVKPPTNNPPKADAGHDIVISLPKTEALLNGNRSRDDNKIVSYHWEQLNGPSKAKIINSDEPMAKITDLTKGDYIFKLTVTDDHGNKDSNSVHIRVTQNRNALPKANAGGDQIISAPVTALVLNGSLSTDDLRIKQWKWTRESTSLAIGNIIPETDKSPVLLLTEVVPGRYVFKLRVTDDQGLYSEDTVSVIIKPDPELYNLVELTLNIGAHLLTESQKESLVLKLVMLLREDAIIRVRNLKVEPRTGRVVIIFYVERKDTKYVIPGLEVVRRLKEKLRQDSGILQLSVVSIETTVCQNNCSGHGTCDQETRQCLCEAFWMQNLLEIYLKNGEYNCEWNILYVIIALVSLVICWIGLTWRLVHLCQRVFNSKRKINHNKKKPPKYSLLPPEADDNSVFSGKKMVLSDSDSDSDIMFDKYKAKSNGYLKNGKLRSKGFLKSHASIKT